MTFEIILLLQMALGAVLATVLYTIIGIIPGTDETSVLVPISAVLVALGLPTMVILTFFIASVVALNVTDSIPTALTSIPGGVMSTPLIESSSYLKEKGQTTKSIKKMTMGSLVGTLVAIPVALLVYLVVYLIEKYTSVGISSNIAKYNNQIFFVGAIVLSLLSKNKLVSLLAIIPFGFVVILARKIHPIGGTPFFLSITIGPLLFNIFLLLFKPMRKKLEVVGNKNIKIEKDSKEKISLFNILGRKEFKVSVISSIIASLTIFLSPVGMTLLIGDTTTSKIEDDTERAYTKVSSMNAIANAAYLAGIMISLLALKFPISPAAMGPGAVIFDPENSFLDLSFGNSLFAILVGVVIALSITIYLSLKYSSKMTELVFKYIPQEAVLALLIGLVVLLVFLDSGIVGLIIILIVSLISGFLNKKGVSYGVQFMAFYAAPLLGQIIGW